MDNGCHATWSESWPCHLISWVALGTLHTFFVLSLLVGKMMVLPSKGDCKGLSELLLVQCSLLAHSKNFRL